MAQKKFIARNGLDNNNHTLSNVAPPQHSTDAATKSVTDSILVVAQNAYNAANNVGPQIEPAYNQANVATTLAQSAYDSSNNNTLYVSGINAEQNTRLTGVENTSVYLQGALNQTNTNISSANTQLKAYSDGAFYSKTGGNITGTVTIYSDLTVTGNLTVSGNVTTVSANNLVLKDNMIYLNENGNTANPDLGISGAYNDGSYHHAGFFRDASDGYWKVYDNYQPEPDASPYIDTSNSSFRIANFQANTVIGGLFSGSGASLTSIPNGALVNSSLTINGTAISLGGSGTVTAAAGTLTGTTLNSGITGSSLTSVGTITSGTWSGSFGAVSGANLTGLTAGNLSGTIPSAVLGNSTHYVGTTAIALNRGSGAQTLTGVSIDGNAATATSTDNIDGIAFKNCDSSSSFVVDTQGTNGIGYSTGYTLFGQTDGGVYCSTYSGAWQHQINGDFRTGQIAIRGKNNGTWQAWRTVLDSSNYNSYAPTLTGGGASGTWGINITGNAQTVGSLSVHSSRNNEANKIVRTDGSGYIQAGWINTTSGDLGVATKLDRVYCSNDGYVRYLGLTDFKTQMGLSAKNSYNRRESTTDANYWVGSMGWGSTYGANEIFGGGSGFIDIWGGTNFPSGTSHVHGFQALHYTTSTIGGYANGYGIQFVGQYGQDGIYFGRSCSNGTFTSWRRFLTEDIWHNNKYFASDGRIYGTILYDSNDTGYYCDPNSTSRFVRINQNANEWNYSHEGWQRLYYQHGDGTIYKGGTTGQWTHIFRNHDDGTRWLMAHGGDFYASGNITAYWSDRRLKKNIEKISDWKNVLNNINGYRFQWNDIGKKVMGNDKDDIEVGLIAQEVNDVFPQAAAIQMLQYKDNVNGELIPKDDIDYDPENPYLTVREEKLIPVLVEALKAHEEEIELLKTKVEKLENILQYMN